APSPLNPARPRTRCAIRKSSRLCGPSHLSGLVFGLPQLRLQVVEQRLGAADSLGFGGHAFFAGVAENDVRQSVERRRHLAACDFGEGLAELGRLRSKLGVVAKDDVDWPLNGLFEILAADLQRAAGG